MPVEAFMLRLSKHGVEFFSSLLGQVAAMNVLLVSFFDTGTLATSYRRALESAGCTVQCFDLAREPVHYRAIERLRRLPLLARVLDHQVTAALNYALACRLYELRPAALLTFNAQVVLPGTLATAQSLGCITASVWSDPVLQLNQPHIVEALPFYDVIYAFSESVCSVLRKTGGARVDLLPLAWDPDLHPVIHGLSERERDRYAADVMFGGKWSPERERVLEALAGHDLAIWGDASWRNARRGSVARTRWRGRPVTGIDFAKACAAAKICVNIVEPAAMHTANMRTFELTGMGRFMIASRNADHLALFSEGEEIVCFATPAELRQRVEQYLPREDERQRIGQAAHRKVAACHTYAHRAAQLVDGLRACRPEPARRPRASAGGHR